MFNRALSAFRKGIVARKEAAQDTDHDDDDNDDSSGGGAGGGAVHSPSALLALAESKGNAVRHRERCETADGWRLWRHIVYGTA